MKLFPQGGRIFEVISRYDDLLALEGKEGYEPGDTLALIVPFLLCHGIREDDIVKLAQKASLTPGAASLISRLQSQGWQVFCISTSYEQYAQRIAHRLGITAHNVACTSLPLDSFHLNLCKEDLALVETIARDILSLQPIADDAAIKQKLDHFYWQQLPATSLGEMRQRVKPRGGQRKVEALEQFAAAQRQPLSSWVVVGDSITDFKMLQAVNQAGGVAIAFNANEYALPYSTMSLASTSLQDLWIVLEAWEKGGRLEAEDIVREKEKGGGVGNRAHFHWLAGGKDLAPALEIHRRIRRLVREEAAKLG